MSETTSDEELKLSDGSYSLSDFQDYFECIIKKHETLTGKLSIQIYVYRIKPCELSLGNVEVELDLI